jgi:hypothetical protein
MPSWWHRKKDTGKNFLKSFIGFLIEVAFEILIRIVRFMRTLFFP